MSAKLSLLRSRLVRATAAASLADVVVRQDLLSQIEKGLMHALNAKAKVRALNTKKKNSKASEFEHEFKLIE